MDLDQRRLKSAGAPPASLVVLATSSGVAAAARATVCRLDLDQRQSQVCRCTSCQLAEGMGTLLACACQAVSQWIKEMCLHTWVPRDLDQRLSQVSLCSSYPPGPPAQCCAMHVKASTFMKGRHNDGMFKGENWRIWRERAQFLINVCAFAVGIGSA